MCPMTSLTLHLPGAYRNPVWSLDSFDSRALTRSRCDSSAPPASVIVSTRATYLPDSGSNSSATGRGSARQHASHEWWQELGPAVVGRRRRVIDDRSARHRAACLDEVREVGLDRLDPARQVLGAMASDRPNAKALTGQLAGQGPPDRPGTDDDVESRLGHVSLRFGMGNVNGVHICDDAP